MLIVIMHLLVSVCGKTVTRCAKPLKNNFSLLALGLIFGLSLGNHYMLMLLISPGLAIMLFPARNSLLYQWKTFLIASGLCLCGLLVYLYLPYAASKNTFINWGNPDTFGRMIAHISREAYRDLEFGTTITSGTRLLFFAHFFHELWQQFTPWLFIFIPLGMIRLYCKSKTNFFATLAIFYTQHFHPADDREFYF